MADLNEAVEVLSDPTRRAEYDRRRSAPNESSAPRPTPPRPHDGASDPDDDLVAVAPAGTTALFGYLPWILLVVVLVGIFVFTAYAGGGPEEDERSPTGGTVEARDIRGSCIRTSGGFVLVANCAQTPHEGEIVVLASDPGLCPEGLDEHQVPQEDVVACTDPDTAVP